MRAAVGIWSKSSRGRRRLLSSAVVDMLTQTTPQNWHRMSARNSAPCVALWYVHSRPVSLRAYWCPLVSLTYMHYVESNSTTSMAFHGLELFSVSFNYLTLPELICVCLGYTWPWGKEKDTYAAADQLWAAPLCYLAGCVYIKMLIGRWFWGFLEEGAYKWGFNCID